MSRLRWYTRRLVTMSPGEVGWRVASSARAIAAERRAAPSEARLLGAPDPDWDDLLRRFRAAQDRPVLLDRERAARVRSAHPDGVARLVAAADRVVAGAVQYFGYPTVRLGDPVDWHLDPVSGTRWPATASRLLDHRSAPGDAKWIWELNRLQHLPWLAQAWLHTGDERYPRTAFAHLDSWLEQNPPGTGIAWRGAFEAGVRAISVAVALQGMRDSPLLTVPRYRAVLRMLAESARRCWADRSRYSSANNHLVGELAGLAVVSLLHPELAGSARGLARALDGLVAEADRQILPDGGGAEQALAYQLFTGDLLVVVAALAGRGPEPVPPEIPAALVRSAAHLAVLVRDGEPVPRVGDDDEGFALRLDTEPVPQLDRHLAAIAAVTGDPVARRYGAAGPAAAWLGDPTPPGAQRRDVPGSRYFPDSGLAVIRARGRRVTMDVGPLGYLAIAAHGHADALAVTLADGGGELVGDPGAGSYYGHPAWRAVHRSTRMHPTVTVDGADQSVSGGPFLWTRKAHCTVHRADVATGVVDAEHDGYTRLAEPVRHRRWLLAGPDDPGVLVVDLLSGSGRHEMVTSWPLHPDLDLLGADRSTAPLGHVATRDGEPVLHLLQAVHAPGRVDDGPEPVAVRGAADVGWWSDRLEQRRPAFLTGMRVRGEVPLVAATLLHLPSEGPRPVGLTVTIEAKVITVVWRERGGATEPRRVTINFTRLTRIARSWSVEGATGSRSP